MVVAYVCQVSHVLDRDTSIVAQPGVQSGIFGGTHFLSPMDLQYHLRRWSQLGIRGHCKQLPGLGNKDVIVTVMAHPRFHLSTTRLILRLSHLMLRCGELSMYFAFLFSIQRCSILSSVHTSQGCLNGGRSVPSRQQLGLKALLQTVSTITHFQALGDVNL